MRTVETLIVGSGFSGLGMAIALHNSGQSDFVVIDRASELGGTWRDNHYPGAACDVPSNLYSFSYDLNPNWSRNFSPQAEIHAYMQGVAKRHGIEGYLQFDTALTKAQWNTEEQRWQISTSRGEFTARHLVLGVGALCEPKLPDIDGISDFGGKIFHTARWDHDTSLVGKRVAIIGTGASAIQVVPAIVDKVAHLDVYQRTAPWILPRLERPYYAPERAIYRRVPGAQRLSRAAIYLSREWQVVGLAKTRAAMAPLIAAAKTQLRLQVRDPELRRKLLPTYVLGCKRILLSNKWYPALTRSHVEVVTTPISQVTSTGIVSADGTEREVDVIVNATGFHVTDAPAFELVHGSDGQSLAQVWQKNGMQAYKGTTVAGFPNLFILVGPATGLGHTSMIYMIESQIAYVMDALVAMRANELAMVNVRQSIQDQYNDALRKAVGETVWIKGGCSSWYLDEHGNAPAVWPHFTFTFRNMTKEFDLSCYESEPRETGQGSARHDSVDAM